MDIGSGSTHADFYPRSPCGERPARRVWPLQQPDFYPRSPCGERRTLLCKEPVDRSISIHALLAESDDRSLKDTSPKPLISIHALLAESDGKRAKARNMNSAFLSTLSLRRATALRRVQPSTIRRFLSTLSLRRATQCRSLRIRNNQISIHALLAESDRMTGV